MCSPWLFNGDNYYKATLSKAEWHVNAGDYGTNYPEDFQRLGDLVAESRLQAAGGMDESQLFWSLSSDERKAVDDYLKNNQKLPEGYVLKTRITVGKIVPSALSNQDRFTA